MEQTGRAQDPVEMGQNDEDIVISGMSVRLPECDNVQEFWENLVNGIDMVTEDDRRWPPGLHNLPRRNGKLKSLSKFDSAFFGVTPKQAESMDPQLRVLLEVTYEALADSGHNMQDVAGKTIGVFIGSTFSDAHDLMSSQTKDISGYEMTGCNRAMLANRISYMFDLKGPSMTVDTACSSGLQGLCLAFSAIRQGRCDSAIVGGVNLLLKPETSLQFKKLNMLSPDGACKAFDESANGYCRSEGVVALYLQKKKMCKRNYMTVMAVLDNVDGYKSQGISYPSNQAQKQLQKNVYNMAGVKPEVVSYIEAHGTGTQAGDVVELDTIEETFCKGRTSSLLVGSLKSNIGHTEAASGLASIVKVILAHQHQLLPANLHYRNPNPKIACLYNKKVQVVSKNTEWKGGIIGVNSFGFGGANVHVVLQSPATETFSSKRPLIKDEKCASLPCIVLNGGRTEEGVKSTLQRTDRVTGCQNDIIALLYVRSLQATLKEMAFKGFSITGKDCLEVVENISNQTPRPLWFVYPGMGCQWCKMAQDMMEISQFGEVINLCQDALKKVRFDLLSVISSKKDNIYDDPLNASVAICAVQIAITVLLKGLGLIPNGILGHSVGELGCAFADDTLTLQQTILAAYWRGKCVKAAKLPPGAMAAVGLTWDEAKSQCPKGVVPACHNAKQTVTISGPKDKVQTFIEELKAKGIFAREVYSSGIAFHSSVMKKCGPALLAALKKVIRNPKPRSERWVSTSVSKEKSNSDIFQMSSAEYHVNNMLSPVLFQEGLEQLPDNALVIEIGPHGLLQALLRRELSKDTVILSTMRKNENNQKHFLTTIGRCYLHGKEINLQYLYGSFKFPVQSETPSIAPLISWQHDEDWFVPEYTMQHSPSQGNTIKIDLTNKDYHYLKDHVIDGRALFPIAGYVVLVWETYAKMNGKSILETNVTIRDLKVHDATIIGDGILVYNINLSHSTGDFEITLDEYLRCTGNIQPARNASPRMKYKRSVEQDIVLMKDDIYKELRLCGYEYGETFQRIAEYKTESKTGTVERGDNWITLIDCLLHIIILENQDRLLKLPTRIKEITIIPETYDPQKVLDVNYNPCTKEITTDFVKIKSPHMTTSQRRGSKIKPVLCSYHFQPYYMNNTIEESISTTSNESVSAMRPRRQHSCVDVRVQSLGKSKGMVIEYLRQEKNTEVNMKKASSQQSNQSFSVFISALDICIENLVKNRVSIGFITGTSKGLQIIENMDAIIKNYPHVQISAWALPSNQELLPELEKSGDTITIHTNMDKAILDKTDIILLDETQVNGFLDEISSKTFVMFYSKQLPKELPKTFNVISQISDADDEITIVRPKFTNQFSTEVVEINSYSFDWTGELKTKLLKVQENDNARIWLVDKSGDHLTGLVGMVNCLLQEPGGDKIRCVSSKEGINDDIIQTDLVMNINKDHTFGRYRRTPIKIDNTDLVEDAYLDILNKGDLSTLTWIQLDSETDTEHNGDVIYVTHSGLNFRDVMVASGRLSTDALPNMGEAVLGLEFAGIDKQGRRKMGICMGKSLATKVRAKSHNTWSVPDSWLLAAAASVPVAYATAYYTLLIRANITQGKTVLIHSAGSAVGQAAIRVAQAYGCEVYITAGTEQKRKFLMDQYKIPQDHVSNSRSVQFVNDFLQVTNGKGVDVILNPLSDEKLKLSLDLLAENGHFLEIGKYDLSNDTQLGMSVFLKNVSFHGVQIETLMDGINKDWKRVHKLIEDGIQNGAVVPLNLNIFKQNEIEQAFRYMAEGKHTGKIVIQINEENNVKQKIGGFHGVYNQIKAVKQVYFSPYKTYIITGGLGGLGLELTNWLIARGAKKVVLTSRTGLKTGYQKRMIKRWTDMKITVVINENNVSEFKAAETMYKEAQKLGPVGGVFHLAAVLNDALFDVQTQETFNKVINIKARGIDNLDKLTRTISANTVEHFVAFSSAAAAYGNAGQTNYGFGNSYMERVCEKRAKDGFPAKAIQWGFIGDVGIVQDNLGGNKLYHMGMIPQRIPSFLEVLEAFLLASDVVYSSIQPAMRQKSIASRGSKVEDGMITAVMNIIGVKDTSKINKSTSLMELGLDSLMVTEIRQVLGRNFDLSLSVTEVQELTLNKLYDMNK